LDLSTAYHIWSFGVSWFAFGVSCLDLSTAYHRRYSNALSLQVIFRKRGLQLVALLRKVIHFKCDRRYFSHILSSTHSSFEYFHHILFQISCPSEHILCHILHLQEHLLFDVFKHLHHILFQIPCPSEHILCHIPCLQEHLLIYVLASNTCVSQRMPCLFGYEVASFSRIDKITGLFCKRAL